MVSRRKPSFLIDDILGEDNNKSEQETRFRTSEPESKPLLHHDTDTLRNYSYRISPINHHNIHHPHHQYEDNRTTLEESSDNFHTLQNLCYERTASERTLKTGYHDTISESEYRHLVSLQTNLPPASTALITSSPHIIHTGIHHHRSPSYLPTLLEPIRTGLTLPLAEPVTSPVFIYPTSVPPSPMTSYPTLGEVHVSHPSYGENYLTYNPDAQHQQMRAESKPWLWGPYLNQRTTNKRKGGQVRFTNEQTLHLETKFSRQKYLSPEERRAMAKSLHLSGKQVKTWFQNRRAKWRRIKQEAPSPDQTRDEDHHSQMTSPTSTSDVIDGASNVLS